LLVLVVGGHRKIGSTYYCVKAQMTVDGKAPTENYRIKIEGLKSHIILMVGL